MDEIKIIPDPSKAESEKGEIFEKLAAKVFSTQRFEVTQRVNFTAMEIDLVLSHMDRNEEAYTECKAKERLKSEEIELFIFKVQHRKMNHGFFLSARPFEHQVAGLIEELRKDERYQNLYFWGPSKLIDLLAASGEVAIPKMQGIPMSVNKRILLYSHHGVYWVLLLAKGTVPSDFCVFEGRTAAPITDANILAQIREEVPEVDGLNHASTTPPSLSSAVSWEDAQTVAEVQESEDWSDPRPASAKYFVGRSDARTALFDFIEKVRCQRTNRRVFYIDGKSGWGKSSIVTDLRGRSRNKRNRSRMFVYAVDTRSATSIHFVALAFKQLVKNAADAGFIDRNIRAEVSSSMDVLASESVKQLLQYLNKHQKVLVLVFDQFEDIFRKQSLFQAFYKFLLDVDAQRGNLVVGFSWKSEINIPIGNEAYHLWQQSRDLAVRFTVREFDPTETNAIIRQFERALPQPIGLELWRKIAESSQGFPWLVKKLCVHCYDEVTNGGETVESLVEKDLNVEGLFKEDEERLSKEEAQALKYIARRAYEDDAVDIVEVDDKVPDAVLRALLNKRLIIKSGTKYNVYWDIFRDYLVTGKVPPIGVSFLIRQHPSACLKLFGVFGADPLSLADLIKAVPGQTEGTILNKVRELRTMGMIQKKGDSFQRHPSLINASDDTIKGFLRKRLSNHALYLRWAGQPLIQSDQLANAAKEVFKGVYFEDKTWQTYATMTYFWCQYAELKLPPRMAANTSSKDSFTPQSRPVAVLNMLRALQQGNVFSEITPTLAKSLYDLKALGFINYTGTRVVLTPLGETAKNQSEGDLAREVAEKAVEMRKIRHSSSFIAQHKGQPRSRFAEELTPVLFPTGISQTYQKSALNILYQWGEFVVHTLGDGLYEVGETDSVS